MKIKLLKPLVSYGKTHKIGDEITVRDDFGLKLIKQKKAEKPSKKPKKILKNFGSK